MMSALALLRPTQWVKNVFVLAPLFFSRNLTDTEQIRHSVGLFALFSLLASCVYVFNDIRDIEADRAHAVKKARPLPSGRVSVAVAWWILAGLLATVALLWGLMSPPRSFAVIVGIYASANLGYSLGLKHVPIVEMFIVASGFVLRLLAGGVFIFEPMSNWIIICTALVATMIVAGKRRADIALDNDPAQQRRVLEQYSVEYLDALMVVLSTSTLVSYLMFCASDYGIRHYGEALSITGLFVAFGVFRFLQLVVVHKRGDAPSTMIVRDPMIVGAVTCWILAYFIILYLA